MIHLIDINESGLSFATGTLFSLRRGKTLYITLPGLLAGESFEFVTKWVKSDAAQGVKAGAQIAPSSVRSYARLVEKIRHIQCWREIEQHLQKKAVPMPEAIRQWHRLHA